MSPPRPFARVPLAFAVSAAAWLALALAPAADARPAKPKAAAAADDSKPVAAGKVTKLVAKIAKDCKILHSARCPALAELVALGPGAVPALLPLLEDPSVDKRAVAAAAVGQLRAADAAPALIRMVKTDDTDSARARSAALSALGFIEAPGVVEALVGALELPDINDKVAAATALGHTKSPAAVAPLLRAMRELHPKVRAAAARGLGSVGAPEAVMPLATLLAEPRTQWPARLAAVEALGRLRAADGVPMLLIELGSQNERVRSATVRALGEIGDKRPVPALNMLLRDPALATEVAVALGRIGDSGALPGLIRVIKERRHPHETLEQAFWSIGSIGARSAVAALKPMLTDEDAKVAMWAADALGRIGDVSAADALVEALKRDDVAVKEMAAWALQKISGRPMGMDVEAWETWLHSGAE